jgi:hypothetical protein
MLLPLLKDVGTSNKSAEIGLAAGSFLMRFQREKGAGRREQGAGSREQGAGSREQGAGSREKGAGRKSELIFW